MDPVRSDRATVIADAAIELIAQRGLRGLTHRAVDEAAGLPQGSTSNRARTRAALLELVLDRLTAREWQVLRPQDAPAPGCGYKALAESLAAVLHRSLTGGRSLLLTRIELAMEANRRPELRARYNTLGRGFREPLAAALAAEHAADPERQARSLVAWCEGVLFYFAAGAASRNVPDLEELRVSATEVLAGMVGPKPLTR
jgi:DNA-binding transcriptional regulator YbjK